MYHKRAEDGEDEEEKVFKMVGEDKGIPDKDGTKKDVIEKMIHIVAPLDQPRIPISADCAIE